MSPLESGDCNSTVCPWASGVMLRGGAREHSSTEGTGDEARAPHAPRCGSPPPSPLPKGGERGAWAVFRCCDERCPLKHMQLAAVIGIARLRAHCGCASGGLGAIRERPCPPTAPGSVSGPSLAQREARQTLLARSCCARSGPCRALVAAAWIPALSRWRRKGRDRASIRRRRGGAVCNALLIDRRQPQTPTTCASLSARVKTRPPTQFATSPRRRATPRNPPMCTPLHPRPR